MNIKDLGYNNIKNKIETINIPEGFEIGRVIVEHKERYLVATNRGEVEAEITGNMRFSATGREDFPAVGDWVTVLFYDDDFAIINGVLPRYSTIKRKAVGKDDEIQMIATNIDYAVIMQAVNRDFSVNRLERYLTICNSSNIKPIILLTKTDLIDKDKSIALKNDVVKRIKDVPVILVSNKTQSGFIELNERIESGFTYCLIGSSGVGKSTLLNNLSGSNKMKTDEISSHSDRGRHISTYRELVVLNNGAILIDNPGMREVGVADSSEGLSATYDQIFELSEQCKFKDCMHINEAGCAVLKAVEDGRIEEEYLINYHKLQRENDHYTASVEEKRRKDKDFGKMVKTFKKIKKKNR